MLEFSVVSFTADKLEIKVKNSSTNVLDLPLTIQLYPPSYLVTNQINELAKEAAKSQTPPGVKSLADIVTGPEGWSVWAKRETSDTTVVILFFNDLDQKTGNELAAPVKLAAGAEFTIGVPLNPQAKRATINLPYSYQYLSDENSGKRQDGILELKTAETSNWTPDVALRAKHPTPNMIPSGTLVKIEWSVKDGVSATLRGPLPGGNSALTLSSDPHADFKISEGVLEIRVVSAMTYVLQAEVKRPDGLPNVQVVRMLSLDTANKKYTYIDPHPLKVLPYGLIEIYWAAWGVRQVELDVSNHTTRVIKLTQQTLGRSFEGEGVMRVSARKTNAETVIINAPPEKQRSKIITVVSWERMEKPDVEGHPWGMAVIAPKIGLLTFEGLHIAEVGEFDDEVAIKKLMFVKKTPRTPTEWAAMTAVEKRFICLRRNDPNPDFELAPFSADGNPDEIPPFTLPPEIRNFALSPRAIFDLVGFGGRVYFVLESTFQARSIRYACSVKFNTTTKKAESRAEPWIESLNGSRLVTFDNALYAVNRESGQMFRFELTKSGTLDAPREAARAVRKIGGNKEESMIKQGLMVPVGRVLVVLSPSSVPSLDSLEQYGLHNVLGYRNTKAATVDPNSVPQDLVYNPQKNYWGRCGHDLNVSSDAVAAFRDGESPRLWVVKPDGETYTLAVGSESLFLHDYVLDYPSKPLEPYLNKTSQFTIKNNTGIALTSMSETYRKAKFLDFTANGPAELVSPVQAIYPTDNFTVEIKYNEAAPAPATLRYLLKMSKMGGARTDCDYMLEVMFSGPNLSSITSAFRRIAIDDRGRVFNDEMFETRVVHPAGGVIEVSRPKQLDAAGIPFVIANSSKFDVKPVGLDYAPGYFSRGTSTRLAIQYKFNDCSLMFDPRQEPNGGEVRVNFNFALPPGVEVSPGNTPQTKRIRLDTDKAKLLRVAFAGLLKPGDPPLKLEGISRPIDPMADHVVYVCQISDKP